MFDATDVWDGDAGTSVTRAGLKLGAAYRFDSVAHQVALPMVKGAHTVWLWELAWSPTEDRVAYCTRGSDAEPAVNGVKVIATDGSQDEWFVDCWSPCWSRDGRFLAMVETRPGPNGTRVSAAVRVVNRAGRSVVHRSNPRRIAWGSGDTLFLEHEDRVEALDVARGTMSPTGYAGCDVSDDGEFSFRYRGQFALFGVVRRAGKVALTQCIASTFGIDRSEPRVLSPFWLRSATRKHLLCFSIVTVASGDTVRKPTGELVGIVDPARSPPGQKGVHTVVFDPETFEVLRDLPGKVVAPTNDHRALVMLLGDSLSRVRLPEWPPEPPRPPVGNVREQIYEWGKAGPNMRLVTDTTVAVVAGDWLPGLEYWGCDQRIRVVASRESPQFELQLPAFLFAEPSAGPRRTRLPLGDTPVRLTTHSFDGGYEVVVSRLR